MPLKYQKIDTNLFGSDDLDEEVSDDQTEEEETLAKEEKTAFGVYDRFANIQLNGPVCPETINPIVDFIVDANLRGENDIELEVINLFIDTDGGALYSAMRMIDAMSMSHIPIRTIGWGTVASAGLMIFMRGDTRIISKNCSILSHNATFNSNSYSIRVNDFSHQKELKMIDRRIMEIYKVATQKDERYIKKHLLTDNDVFLSAEEAIRHGLADGYLPFGMNWLRTFDSTLELVELG